MAKTVFVAMSGGVDSSAAAALMKKAGFNVVGVFMKPWQPNLANSKERIANSQIDCMWKEDREDVLRVAVKLDIPLLTWDFSKEYEKYVAEYMVEGYRQGITPNPDVMCNKFIKFGLFLDKALKLGADFIATGHYARKVGNKLFKAKDLNKDQSYFLYTLTQEQLKHCLFPIGDYKKDKVRKLAKKFGLPNWAKPDSQGVCFVGPFDVKEFLKRYIQPKNGLALRKSDGKILGEHDGAWFYTIGQRHGFGLSAGKAYFVEDKDIKKNILYVDEKPRITNSELRITDYNWLDGNRFPVKCQVKTRYRQEASGCIVKRNGSDMLYAELLDGKNPVALGQSAVFYKGNQVLGGGIIS